MDEDWRNAGICDGVPSTYSSLYIGQSPHFIRFTIYTLFQSIKLFNMFYSMRGFYHNGDSVIVYREL